MEEVSFGDDFTSNAVVFDVDNGSLSQTDNRKNNFLVLREWPKCVYSRVKYQLY